MYIALAEISINRAIRMYRPVIRTTQTTEVAVQAAVHLKTTPETGAHPDHHTTEAAHQAIAAEAMVAEAEAVWAVEEVPADEDN